MVGQDVVGVVVVTVVVGKDVVVVVVVLVVVGKTVATRLETNASTSASATATSPVMAQPPRASMRAQVASNFAAARASQAGSTARSRATARAWQARRLLAFCAAALIFDAAQASAGSEDRAAHGVASTATAKPTPAIIVCLIERLPGVPRYLGPVRAVKAKHTSWLDPDGRIARPSSIRPAHRRVTVSKPMSSAAILDLGRGFMGSKVLLVAVKLGLFDALRDGPLTGSQLRERLGLHPRAIPDFTDALVALGMLERDGDGPDARYANTAETARFLVRSSEAYMGGILEMYDARLFRFWSDLEEALRTGRPQNEAKHTGVSMFEELYREPARLEQFMAAMSGISRPNFLALAERFDFAPYRTLCDVGGAAADLSCAVAARHPHLRCTSFDLPVVEPIARAAIARRGLSDRVTSVAGDFFRDPLPRADVITMGMILHDWNLEKKQALIRAAHAALPDGGVFIAVEHLIDDQRRENVFGLLMSLNMLIEFGDAFDFTGADFTAWCTEAGFRRIEVLPLGGPASAAIAHK